MEYDSFESNSDDSQSNPPSFRDALSESELKLPNMDGSKEDDDFFDAVESIELTRSELAHKLSNEVFKMNIQIGARSLHTL